MTRWSLSNLFMSVSFEQFQSLTRQFKAAAEASFGTECRLEVKALKETKVYTTFKDDDIQDGLDYLNNLNFITSATSLDEMTKDIWDQAGYVEVILHPKNEKAAPSYAFAHVEFKGELRRTASFYIQPDGVDARDRMISQNRRMWPGEGWGGNGTRSGAIPSSLSF